MNFRRSLPEIHVSPGVCPADTLARLPCPACPTNFAYFAAAFFKISGSETPP
jgi:hypothetical protein